jgi:flagellar FliL protein
MDLDDERDEDENEAAEGEGEAKVRKPLPRKLIIIVAAVLVLLIGGGGGAFVLLSGDDSAPADGEVVAEEEFVDPEAKPIYFAIDPPITVNFQRGERIRFLQVSVEVMTRNQDGIDALNEHMPVVRNNLNMLFSGQDYETLSTRDGKEGLRKATTAEIQKILKDRAGISGIEETYFTAFVMQ